MRREQAGTGRENGGRRRRTACAIVIAALAVLPLPGHAGAWPREPGRTFLSFGTERVADGDAYISLYGERGLARGWTAVLDAGGDPDGGDGSAALTVRMPLDDGTGADRRALSFGGGLIADAERTLPDAPGLGQARPFLRAGAHWGRGIETGLGSGWAGVDALLDATVPVVPGDSTGFAWKIDATLGINATERLAGIVQLQTGSPLAGNSYARLQGTLVRQLSPAARVEAGVILGLSGTDDHAVRAGVWFDF